MQDDSQDINTKFALVAISTVVVLTIGVFFYHTFEKLNLVDAIYFSVITLATVGYGDITPHTDIGKLFTCFYVIAGIAILGTFANLLVKRAGVRHQVRKQRSSEKK
jgi:voltage-gated potassium channel